MLAIDTSHPVMVTGATGYVAGWIIARLLESGLTVHAAVRNPADTARLAHLDDLAARSGGTIRYFKADLLSAGSYDEAMADCRIVFHTASPFTLDVRDPQTQLIDPALRGTQNILDSVERTTTVERLVLTSSCAAIYGDNRDLLRTANGRFTENDWNTTSSLQHQPYFYSKTLAERAAWEAAERQSRWKLVVLNPSLVIGPGLNAHATSESFNVIRQFGDGRMRFGAPDLGLGVVDVRDVAEAHLRAAFLPEAGGRHILSGYNTSLPALAQTLLPRYAAYPIPRRTLPTWLVWLAAPLTDRSITRRFVRDNVGLPWIADNSKSQRALGLHYRPLQESMHEMFAQLIASGQLPAR